jgi:hypothetical protein
VNAASGTVPLNASPRRGPGCGPAVEARLGHAHKLEGAELRARLARLRHRAAPTPAPPRACVRACACACERELACSWAHLSRGRLAWARLWLCVYASSSPMPALPRSVPVSRMVSLPLGLAPTRPYSHLALLPLGAVPLTDATCRSTRLSSSSTRSTWRQPEPPATRNHERTNSQTHKHTNTQTHKHTNTQANS